MRDRSRCVLLAALLVMTFSVGAGATVPDEQKPVTERSVSLVVRVKPDRLKKAASELAAMVQGGESLGLPWLKEAFGAVSAEIVVEDVEPSGSASTAFRASSAGWTGSQKSPSAEAPPRSPESSSTAASAGRNGASLAAGYATAAAIISRHAAAIREGAAALIESLPADQAADVRRQLDQLGGSAGAVGKALESLMPDTAPRPDSASPPKR